MELIITAIIAFIFGLGVGSSNNQPQYKKPKKASRKNGTNQSPEPTLDQQFLTASSSNTYQKQLLLNQGERKIYWTLVKYLKNKYCINPQASLGEVLSCKNEIAYRAINSKRSDFVITDKQFKPIAVIEYQGDGHYQGNHKIRNQTKFNALSNAGIAYVELHNADENHVYKKLIACNFIQAPSNT